MFPVSGGSCVIEARIDRSGSCHVDAVKGDEEKSSACDIKLSVSLISSSDKVWLSSLSSEAFAFVGDEPFALWDGGTSVDEA